MSVFNLPPQSSDIQITYLVYILHLFSAATGVISSAFVVTAFLTGWPSIVAVIINYVKRRSVTGTYLESHFVWQIRTFWFALLWFAIAAVLALTLIALPLAYLVAVIAGLWVLYRVLRGLLTLAKARQLP